MDKIICVGKNYLAHAKELGDVVPEKPVLFLKPPSVLKQAMSWEEPLQVFFPDNLDEDVHPECEIILLLSDGGYKISKKKAEQAIVAVTIGLDMTLRKRQTELKKQGHPWTIAKVFPDAAIIGPWIPLANFSNYLDIDFSMSINGQVKQKAIGNQMMLHPADLIVYISQYFPLCAGDAIFTGTPAGVTKVTPHDIITLIYGNKILSVHYKMR